MSATPPDSAPDAQPADRMNEAEMDPSTLSTETLLHMLRQDRLWLLRQIDSGRWPQWRLDLAALERELGLLLDQAADRCARG